MTKTEIKDAMITMIQNTGIPLAQQFYDATGIPQNQVRKHFGRYSALLAEVSHATAVKPSKMLLNRYETQKSRAMIESIKHVWDTIKPGTIKVKRPRKSGKLRELTFVPHLSDPHSGKRILYDGREIYNDAIMQTRLTQLWEQWLDRIENEKPRAITLLFTGDNTDGTGVYEGQQVNQSIFSVPYQMEALAGAIMNFLAEVMLRVDRRVKIKLAMISGNHGGTLVDNYDIALYIYLAGCIKWAGWSDQIEVQYTAEEFLLTDIEGWAYMLRHSMPRDLDSANAKIGRWETMHRFDVAACGHLHNEAVGHYQGRPLIRGGCLPGSDDYAEGTFAYDAPASQSSWIVTPDDYYNQPVWRRWPSVYRKRHPSRGSQRHIAQVRE